MNLFALFHNICGHFLRFASAVKAHQFFTEETWDNFKQVFEVYMFDAAKVLLCVVYTH